MSITDIEAIEMSRKLAEYHKDLAIEAALWKGVRPLDLVHEYHSDLAERLTIEVNQIPERITAAKRAKERYRAIDDGWLGAK
jgi:hypothetical protein